MMEVLLFVGGSQVDVGGRVLVSSRIRKKRNKNDWDSHEGNCTIFLGQGIEAQLINLYYILTPKRPFPDNLPINTQQLVH